MEYIKALYREILLYLPLTGGALTGDLTLEAGLLHTAQQYTADGAIAQSGLVELEKSASGLTMTLADPPGAGLLLIITQSDSGIAGHTVTAATGAAFDGTNEIATFNAQHETLVLLSVSDTRWVIIANIGGVGLST